MKYMEVFVMAITADLLQSLVPISQFNKGQAAKIFDRLHSERELIVLKNNQPSAIILSPEEYTRLTEIEEDYFLLLEAKSEDYGEGFADAFDVKNFSVYDVDTTDSATTSGVRTVVVDGLKKMDFSRLSIDCGTY